MDVRKLLGTNIRRYRLSAEITQEELAAKMGVEQYYISGLEAGRRNPTIETLGRIVMALGVGVSQLLTEEQRTAPKRKSRKRQIN